MEHGTIVLMGGGNMETDNTELAQVGALFMRLYDRFSVLEAQRFGSQGVDNLTLVEIQTIFIIKISAEMQESLLLQGQ